MSFDCIVPAQCEYEQEEVSYLGDKVECQSEANSKTHDVAGSGVSLWILEQALY